MFDDAGVEESIFSILGSSNSFDCSSFGNPPPDIVWSKDGSVLSADDTLTVNGSSLQLHNVDLRHNGTYTCEISNIVGKVSKNFNFHVYSKCCIYLLS